MTWTDNFLNLAADVYDEGQTCGKEHIIPLAPLVIWHGGATAEAATSHTTYLIRQFRLGFSTGQTLGHRFIRRSSLN